VLTPLLRSDGDVALANASVFLEAFGHTVLAWTWLRQAVVADGALAQAATPQDADFYRGKLQACRFFFACELPQIELSARLVREAEPSAFEMSAAWF
jgi:butyryl-CoA dehydrogenase